MRRALLAAVVLAAAGCGGSSGTAAPSSVRAALAQVDAAVQAHDYARARSGLDLLVARTIAERDQGRLPADQATDVLAAAAQLRADLPTPPRPTPQPAPSAPKKRHGHEHKGGD